VGFAWNTKLLSKMHALRFLLEVQRSFL